MKAMIFHHDDLDGAASAAILRWACWQDGYDVECEEVRHGQSLIRRASEVQADCIYVVDYTPQEGGGIAALAEVLGDTLIWIDHHATAIGGWHGLRNAGDILGLRLSAAPDGTPVAACELAWRWVYGDATPQPNLLTLIGDWDTWRHAKIHGSLAPDVKRYFDQFLGHELVTEVERLLLVVVHPTTGVIDAEADDRCVRECVRDGAVLGRYERVADAALMRARAFEGTFAGHPAILANGGERGAGRFASVYRPEDHALMVLFFYDAAGYWSVSVYSERADVDCGEICRALGHAGPMGTGGGHRKAAGFQTSWEHLCELIVRADGQVLC